MKHVITPFILAAMAGGLTACGGGGGGTPTTPVPTTPVDRIAPSVSFSPSSLSVDSGATGSSTLTISDAGGVGTLTPTISCTNGGSYNATTNTFTAPSVSVDTTVTCTATQRDLAGNTGSGTLTVTVIAPPDTEAPVLSFSPETLTVTSAQTGASSLSATDNVGVTTGPTVTCTNGGSWSGGTFTAPTTATDLTSVCTATASDAAGNQGTATLTVSVTGVTPDTEAPVVTFSPDSLSLNSGESGTSTLSATDNVGVTSGPTVTCDNGGTFANNSFTAPTTATDVTVTCTATASDAAGNEGTDVLTVAVTGQPITKVTISGKITFDEIKHNTATSALNYNTLSAEPARGVVVEAIDGAGGVLASTVTDASGDYSLDVDPDTNVRIRAKAQMLQTTGAKWDVRVIDNTSSGALYAMTGTSANAGTQDSTRNLHAPSGWGGSAYTSERVAGPFAILDPIYLAVKKVEAADADADLPQVSFNWSVNNTNSSGNRAQGQIGTSFYDPSEGNLYILGEANDDTDEYDSHVVVHEWGHYFEDKMSRSDSIGGQHSGRDRLDPRVAMGEGFGNAISGIVTDDPFYRDSFGSAQGNGFDVDVENNTNIPTGWWNEASVQSIIYDLYDSANDGSDTVSLGFKPIYDVMTSAAYKEINEFTTIFSFAHFMRGAQGSSSAAVNSLMTGQGIDGTGTNGAGETHNGGLASNLPVFKSVTVGGSPVEICSVDNNGSYNKLGNRAYVTVELPTTARYTFNMSVANNESGRDAEFSIYRQGEFVGRAASGTSGTEIAAANLDAGTYVIDAYDANNTGGGNGTEGDACYNFSVTQ